MSITLHVSRELSLPAEAVSETFAILAKRGAGKTYTAAVMVEELLKAGVMRKNWIFPFSQLIS
jgi:uncharacterized protein